jgi:hypothetical protein
MHSKKHKKELQPIRKYPTFDEIFPDKTYLLIILMGICALIISMAIISTVLRNTFRPLTVNLPVSSVVSVTPAPDVFTSPESEISGNPEEYDSLSPEPQY